MSTDNSVKTLSPPEPAFKLPCPICLGRGWREQQVRGSDILQHWRCAFCAGTGFIWTEKGKP